MTNHFHIVEPTEALKKYVSCYYFIKSDDDAFSNIHYSFPHTYNALNIYKDSEFHSHLSSFSARPSLTPNYQIFVQAKKQTPLMVDLSGKINRTTILFKDFGINHFISEPLPKIMGYHTNQFRSWVEDSLFPCFMKKLFGTDNECEKGKIIDEFLLQRFMPVSLSYLESAVALLCEFEKNIPVHEIADQLHVSLRSFNRNFKDVLGVSPIEYRRIAQFRYSIEIKFFQPRFKRLTDIGYASHFYDQSYFNKIYHQLTGSNPKKFFDSVKRIGNNQLVFQFIEK